MGGRVDVDMQLGIKFFEFRQTRQQAGRSKQRQHAEAQAHVATSDGHLIHRFANGLHRWSDRFQQHLTIRVQHHRLVAPLEQRLANMILQRLDSAAQRRG